jgi:hypothetical protein
MSTSERTSERNPGHNGKFYKLYKLYLIYNLNVFDLTINQHFINNFLVLISYIKKQNTKTSYWKFLNIHRDIIVTSIVTTSKTFSENWSDLDNLWSSRFIYTGKNLHISDFKDKVRFFLFCKGRVP